MNRQKTQLNENQDELNALYADFLFKFETVFGGQDWLMTKDVICDENFISPNGDFLNPKVDDESNNWFNRGSLLNSFRRLRREMVECGLYPEKYDPTFFMSDEETEQMRRFFEEREAKKRQGNK